MKTFLDNHREGFAAMEFLDFHRDLPRPVVWLFRTRADGVVAADAPPQDVGTCAVADPVSAHVPEVLATLGRSLPGAVTAGGFEVVWLLSFRIGAMQAPCMMPWREGTGSHLHALCMNSVST